MQWQWVMLFSVHGYSWLETVAQMTSHLNQSFVASLSGEGGPSSSPTCTTNTHARLHTYVRNYSNRGHVMNRIDEHASLFRGHVTGEPCCLIHLPRLDSGCARKKAVAWTLCSFQSWHTNIHNRTIQEYHRRVKVREPGRHLRNTLGAVSKCSYIRRQPGWNRYQGRHDG